MSKIPDSELIINRDGSVYHLNLKPKDISETIIAVGDPGRVYRVSKFFDTLDFEMNKREFITHTGTYKGKKITVISTGMGTDNIEILMTELDALVNIDFKTREVKKRRKKLNIVKIGTSGSIQNDIRLGTHLVSEYAIGLDNLYAYYDFPQDDTGVLVSRKLKESLKLPFEPYCTRCSEKLLEKIAFDMLKGNTLSAPGFYAPQGRKVRIEAKNPSLLNDLIYFHIRDFWLTNFEMEASAYYGFGKLMGHEVLCLNAIIANRVKKTFSKNYNKIIDSLIEIVLERI
jgi:uridine phosphorylase